MRVRITFKVKNRGGLVPFHHQHLIAQILRGLVVNEVDQSFIDYPHYGFSGLKGQTEISKSGLHFNSSRVTIVLSSPKEDFLDFLVDQLMTAKKVQIGELVLSPIAADKEVQVHLETKTKLLAIAPMILIESEFNANGSKRFVSPGTDEFSDLLYDGTVKRMEMFGMSVESIPNAEKFQIVPDFNYLKRMRASQKKFSRIYAYYHQDVKYEVRGYTFPFTLHASREIQDFIFTCGLGFYGNKGFGMVDVAHSDPRKRTANYQSRDLVSA